MQVSGKTLTFDRTLWVQYDGVAVQASDSQIAITGRDEASYLKVLNHFGRVLKLYTFEDGRWLDADTGGVAQPFDETQAGRLTAAAPPPGTTPAADRPAPRKPRQTRPAAQPSAGSRAKAGAKPPTRPAAKPAAKGAARATGRSAPSKRSGRRTG
jgi:cell division septation protein DedD